MIEHDQSHWPVQVYDMPGGAKCLKLRVADDPSPRLSFATDDQRAAFLRDFEDRYPPAEPYSGRVSYGGPEVKYWLELAKTHGRRAWWD